MTAELTNPVRQQVTLAGRFMGHLAIRIATANKVDQRSACKRVDDSNEL